MPKENTTPAVVEQEFTEEETAGHLLMHEADILDSLLGAAEYAKSEDAVRKIEIARNGKVYFAFRIRPLTEEEYQKCKTDHTKKIMNKNLKVKVGEELNTVRYRSGLIYAATIEEDREKVWNNKEAWRRLNVACGVDLIDQVLLAGEKDSVLDRIDEMSGYNQNMEETAKN